MEEMQRDMVSLREENGVLRAQAATLLAEIEEEAPAETAQVTPPALPLLSL
jgi:hypothetical protein